MKQYPSQFDTEDEIAKQLRRLFGLLPFDSGQLVARSFYDILKIAYYMRRDKSGRARPNGNREVGLNRREVARVLELVSYHHRKAECFPATNELATCFGTNFGEADAIDFYERFLENVSMRDKFGRPITIGEDALMSLYKNPVTGQHEMESMYYVSVRGKRLAWIKPTLRNSREIYEQTAGGFLALMYVCEYSIRLESGETDNCYFVVIVERRRRDYPGSFKFRTAFPIMRYNDMLRKMAGWKPAHVPQKNSWT
jgi:hypothetical protein